jgi:imidazolonepropionase-like amidohydrolase
MAKTVTICGKRFDGLGDTMRGPTEILIEGDTIVEVSGSVGRPGGAYVLDLSDRTVSPGFWGSAPDDRAQGWRCLCCG